jgi:hypothetical protein
MTVGSLVKNAYSRVLSPYNTDSFVGKGRARRWKRFVARFPDLAEMSVLDLGGAPIAWKNALVQPAHVTCVNRQDMSQDATATISVVTSDVFALPATTLRTNYDLVYCSSLIEHVGGPGKRKELAMIIQSICTDHWVQAPYRYFPIEPHWVFPFFQFLPLQTKAAISRHWDAGGYTAKQNRESSVELALEVDLPSVTEFRYLFPASELIIERLAGLPKSLIAVSNGLSGHSEGRGVGPHF